MAEIKTKRTSAGVADYLAAIEDPVRREDCRTLADLMRKITQHEPAMWGPAIVGFDSYRYPYANGTTGTMCLTGFSSRKQDITIYLMAGFAANTELLARIGKHKASKSCFHVKRLANIALPALEELITLSVTHMREKYSEQ